MAKNTQKSAEKTNEETIPPLGREKLPEEVQQKTSPDVEQRDTPNPDETYTRPAPVICERCKVEMKVSKTGRTTRFFKCPKCGCGAQRMKESVAQALKKQHENRIKRAEALKEKAEHEGR